MLFQIILGVLVVALAAGIYKIKSMRQIDVESLFTYLMFKTGMLRFLHWSGMTRFNRGILEDLAAPNGHVIKVHQPHLATIVTTLRDLETRDDDVFITSYCKSGTTWIQEIAWLICNDVDIKRAKKNVLSERSPFLEFPDIAGVLKGLQSIENFPRTETRVMKTHMPWEFLPKQLTSGRGGKIIWVARNPKDTCVSFYFFHIFNYFLPNSGTWDEFYANFCSGNVHYGGWFSYTLKFWEEYQKRKDLYHFVTYEALKKDLRSEVAKIAKFLGKDLSDEQIDAIARHCTFDSMSKNDATNYSVAANYAFDFSKVKFMRKGQVGDWKNYFTINQNEAFDELYREKMEGTGLDFEFE